MAERVSTTSYAIGDRPAWPGGARCAVMLSFDVDGPSVWIDSDPTTWSRPVLFSLGAYGPARGLPRILRMLREFGLSATFFVPGWVAEHWPESFAAIVADGHEVGHHGYLHELYFSLGLERQREIIGQCQEIFTRLGGEAAVGYRSPSGDIAEGTPALLADLGFSYSSSMRGDDRPYRWTLGGAESDLIEIPAHWELDDFPHFGFNTHPSDPEGEDRIGGLDWALDNWRREFDGYYREGLCYPLILHPQVIGTPARVELLRRLIAHIVSHDDVWVATGAQIASWWRDNY